MFSWCLLTKFQFTKIPVALESIRAYTKRVSEISVVSKVIGRQIKALCTSSTLMVRCQKSFFFYLEQWERDREIVKLGFLSVSVRSLFSLYSFTNNIVNLFLSSQSIHIASHFIQDPDYQSFPLNLLALWVLVVV